MTENPFSIDLGVPTPEQDRDRLVKKGELTELAIEVYADLYRKLYLAVENGDKEVEAEVREEIEILSKK